MALFNVSSFEDLIETTELLGDVFQTQKLAEQYINETQENIEMLLSELPEADPVKVAILNVTPKSISIQRQGTTAVEMANMLQLENIGSSLAGEEEGATSAPFSMEVLVEEQPDVIFMVMHGDPKAGEANLEQELTRNEAWQALDAVVEDRVVILDSTRFLTNPIFEFDESLREMAEYAYPELKANE